jgi:hypothetical protein
MHRRRRNNKGNGGNIAFGAIIVLVIYLMVAGYAGKWVAKYVITPIFGAAKQSENVKEEGEKGNESIPLVLEDRYFIQLGVYDKEKNAEDKANTVRGQGAAGYILNDNGKYRVLGWGYQAEENAKKVKEQLSDEGVESEIFTHKGQELTLKVEGIKTDVEAVKDGVRQYKSYMDKLENLCMNLDKSEIGEEGVMNELTEMQTALKGQHTKLNGLNKNHNKVVEALANIYQTYEENVSKLLKEDTIQLSHKIKHLHIEQYFAFAEMLDGIKP